MALKKKVSFEVFLDDNDKNEINSVLPQLAKRRLLKQKDLGDEWCGLPDENFLELLESFNLSFAKEVDDNWNSDEKELNDIPGFPDAILYIEKSVYKYIENHNFGIKVTDFEGQHEFGDWLLNFDYYDIRTALENVLWDNRGNPLADQIIQAIAEN